MVDSREKYKFDLGVKGLTCLYDIQFLLYTIYFFKRPDFQAISWWFHQ